MKCILYESTGKAGGRNLASHFNTTQKVWLQSSDLHALTQGAEDLSKLRQKASEMKPSVLNWREKCFKEGHTLRNWGKEHDAYSKEILGCVDNFISEIDSSIEKIKETVKAAETKLIRKDPVEVREKRRAKENRHHQTKRLQKRHEKRERLIEEDQAFQRPSKRLREAFQERVRSKLARFQYDQN